MGKFYAIKVGKTPGIYTDWPTAQAQVKGFPGAIYKSFATKSEAQAFLDGGAAAKPSAPTVPVVEMYTDGSNKNGVGGAGVVILINDTLTGALNDKYTAIARVPEKVSTNQIAELYAIYIGLSLVPDRDVKVYTDSQYAITSLTGYIHDWVKNGWSGVANRTYMESCYDLMQNRQVTFQHVRGHTGNQYNEEADKLAELGRYLEIGEDVQVQLNGENIE